MDFEVVKTGFEQKYFKPSHIKFDYESATYQSKCKATDGDPFDKLAIQTNNMFSIWKSACNFAYAQKIRPVREKQEVIIDDLKSQIQLLQLQITGLERERSNSNGSVANLVG